MKLLPYADSIGFPRFFRVLRNDGVGRLIPIPLPCAGGKIFFYDGYARAMAKAKAWGGMCLPDGRFYVKALDMLFTSFYYFSIMANEWGSWERQYLVTDVRGKTVLDAGAACGDTAMLFIFHGAKKVFSIEPDPGRFACLKRNVEAHGWPVECINDIWRPEYMNLGFDFAKIDIELGDRQVFKLERLPPCVIEVHGPTITEAFIKKFHMRRMRRGREQNIVTNL